MEKSLKDKLIKIINSNDFNEEIKKLTYDEKIIIFYSPEYTCSYFRKVCTEKNAFLLNEEEVKRLMVTNNKFFRYNAFRDDRIEICDFPDDYLFKEFRNSKKFKVLLRMKNKKVITDYVATSCDDSVPSFDGKISDEIIEQMVLDPRNQKKEKQYNLINQFQNDEYRIMYLSKVSQSDKHIIIGGLKNDDIKKKYINVFTPDKGYIISTFNSDNDKIKYLKKYNLILSSDEKALIFSSFNDKSLIKDNMKYLAREKDISLVMCYCYKYSPEFFEEEILKTNNEKSIADFLITYHINKKAGNFNEDLVKKLVTKISNQNLLFDILNSTKKDDMIKIILPRLSPKKIEKYIKENMGYHLSIKTLLYIDNDKLLFDAVENTEFSDKYSDEILPIFEKFSQKYNLNLNHLVELAKTTNCSILNYLNSNIINAINLDEESFNKYLNIFKEDNKKLNLEQINTILVSILHKKFDLRFPSEVNIFANTLIDARNDNIDDAIEAIKNVSSVVNLKEFNIDIDQLINGILKGDNDILKLYNKITYKYLIEKRNNYVNHNMEDALRYSTKWKYEKNSFLKYFTRLYETDKIIGLVKNNNDGTNIYKIFENEALLREIIEFKKGNISYDKVSSEAKSKIKDFEQLYLSLLERNIYFDANYESIELSKTYAPNLDKIETSIINIMSNIDVYKLKDTVFNKEDLYNDLLSYIKKYGMIAWNDNFNSNNLENDINFTTDVVASFISNFSIINKERKRKEDAGEIATFIGDIAYAECLNSSSSLYAYLLGAENFRYLSRNPAPFSSPLSKEKRFEKAVSLLREMHNRDFITVPPIDEDIDLDSGKKINISLGITNDPINLTLGERTESCMRIGGVASSLLEFCLLNENGFHVIFNDTETNDLISRGSCFRNGNTLFINQARDPIGYKYTYKEIQNAWKFFGKRIIELTKDSSYPIENVVCGYFFDNSEYTDLECNNIKKGLSDFYTDIKKDAVIIATKNDGKLVPIKTGPNNCEKYKVIRKKVKKYDSLNSINATGHIEALDQFYMGKNLDEIEVSDKEDIDYSYVGEDWYVAVTNDKEIISYIQNSSRDKDSATKELNKYLSIVKKELNIVNNTSYNNSNQEFESEEIKDERSR